MESTLMLPRVTIAAETLASDFHAVGLQPTGVIRGAPVQRVPMVDARPAGAASVGCLPRRNGPLGRQTRALSSPRSTPKKSRRAGSTTPDPRNLHSKRLRYATNLTSVRR